MNFQQLEYVLAVDKHQQFWSAADDCNVTQATLSAMIKKLEEELNIVLFDRSSKPIKTTKVGKEFIQIAKGILDQRNLLFEIGDEDQEIKGEVKIGVIPTIATSLLPMLLPLLLETNKNLKLEIKELTTEEIKKQLYHDQLDFGILATPIEEEDLDEHVLYYEPMMVYGIETDKGYVTSSDVKEGEVWLLEEGHCFRNQTLTICEVKEKEVAHKNLNFRGSTFETLLNLTDQFGGFTLVPELYQSDLSEARKKKSKHFENPIPVREISLINYRKLGNKRLIDYLCKTINALVAPKLSSNNLSNDQMEVIGIY